MSIWQAHLLWMQHCSSVILSCRNALTYNWTKRAELCYKTWECITSITFSPITSRTYGLAHWRMWYGNSITSVTSLPANHCLLTTLNYYGFLLVHILMTVSFRPVHSLCSYEFLKLGGLLGHVWEGDVPSCMQYNPVGNFLNWNIYRCILTYKSSKTSTMKICKGNTGTQNNE